MKSSNNRESDNIEETAFLVDSSKESAVIVAKLGISFCNPKLADLTMAEMMVTQVVVIFACIVVSLAMIGRIVSRSRRIHDPIMPVRITVIMTNQTLTHGM
jgi:hypothetical protein